MGNAASGGIFGAEAGGGARLSGGRTGGIRVDAIEGVADDAAWRVGDAREAGGVVCAIAGCRQQCICHQSK